MKGFKTAVIIIAVLLIVIGGAICFFGIASIDFDFDKLATNEAVTKEYTAEGEFDRIFVDSILSEIKIVSSEDDTCRVTYSDTRKLPLSISVEGGELKVVQKDGRKWFERIGIFTTKTEIVVYLPKAEYESLGVCNTVGDLYVQSGFTFGSASVDATTGDVEFNASVKGDLNVNATTGDVEIGGKDISDIHVESTTGDIELSSVTALNGIQLSATTGKITVSDVTCKQIIAETTTGGVSLDNVVVSGMMKLDTSTGAVRLDMCDAADIYIETTTGSVTGTLLSEKQFFTETSTGKVNVPPSGNGGRCQIETGTGNIRIEIN